MRRIARIAPLLQPFTGLCAAVAVVCLTVVAGPASGQGDPQYIGWSKIEGAKETRDIKDRLREGIFDEQAKRYFRVTVLPQLALAENRPTIERTRRRMRELLLTDIPDEGAFADAMQTVADFMEALARDENAEPVVRVNAMLLMGELRSKAGKPWAPAAAMLAAAAGDATLPMAVRISAMAGINRHVDAVRSDPAALAAAGQACGPALRAIIAEPLNARRRIEQEWLAARAISVLPSFVRSSPRELAALLADILEDETRSADTRVRAAAALGATADAASGVDATGLIKTINGLAIQLLEAEATAAANRRLEKEYHLLFESEQAAQAAPEGGGRQAAAPEPAGIPEQACRRLAWQLASLADAIVAGDNRGLARLAGNAAGRADELARVLRNVAALIDETPDGQSVIDALTELQALTGEAVTAKPTRKPGEEKPAAEPAAESNASPFDSGK